MQITILFIALSLTIIGCSNSSDSGDNSSVTAPASIRGKFYKMTINSGSGLFATAGTYTISFSPNQNTYTVEGDDVNVVDSEGTYTYSTNGSTGVAAIVDSIIGNGAFSLTFTSSTAESDPNSMQTGTFTE